MTVVVVQGATDASEVPGIDRVAKVVELRYAPDSAALAAALPGADVMFGWNFRGSGLADAWPYATDLKWLQWAGAGVDGALFPGIVQSDVVLTNMRGIFDRAMAEWALGYILVFSKKIDTNFIAAQSGEWHSQITEKAEGKRVLVVGTGSIGTETGRLLRAIGMQVCGVGRKARAGGEGFEKIFGVEELNTVLPEFDFVVLVTPLTDQTRDLFGAAQFAQMKPTARFLNMGRGALVDEEALISALHAGEIAGAALDVFREEPLPADSPVRRAPNCLLSPHNSGDYTGYYEDMVSVFVDNLERYTRGDPLRNLVDKAAGFAAP